MPLRRLHHAAAGLVASVAAIAVASPAAADPMAPIPGNGFFPSDLTLRRAFTTRAVRRRSSGFGLTMCHTGLNVPVVYLQHA